MTRIDILRRQHDDALAMAQRLLELVDQFQPGQTASPIVLQLNRLHGLLRIHFAHEDFELYPRLVSSPDPKIARIAQGFVDEMGALASEIECFARHWPSSASIAANFDEFREAVNELMLALAVRIERENRLLFPLLAGDGVAPEDRRDAA
ncbi:MAG TPA: hemerythrin domain-containing protein [Sphingomicrobium sp.]|nr:hemerythrin domain-containing protein [Sphingomicrobium sp.]